MATPLNAFKTKTFSLRDSDTETGKVVYSTPPGVTAIVLMAQISNADSADRTCNFSFIHKDTSSGTETSLVKNFPVRSNDAASPLTGKLIVQENNQLFAYVHKDVWRREIDGVLVSDTDDSLKLTLSLLESLNA